MEELSERGDSVRTGNDAKDDVAAFLCDLPVSKRAALTLGRSKGVEFLAYALLAQVANDKPISVALRAGMTLCRQSSPAPHPGGAVIETERAGDR